MLKIVKTTMIRVPSAQEDRAITAAARSDPDTLPLTSTQLKQLKNASTILDRSLVTRRINVDEVVAEFNAARKRSGISK